MGALLMTSRPDATDDLLSVQQAADLLGVSRPKVYDLMARGQLKPVAADNPVLNKQRRKFRRADVERLARGEPPETPEPPAED